MSDIANLASAASETMVDIGGYRLCLSCAGQGTPTVVLEAGLGEGLNEWVGLLPQVAAFTRVCAYDRAGVGKSDAGPKPRTSQQMVAELRTLLRSAQVDGPYVLVGQSLGGLNVALYAAEHPDEVGGLVLLDPAVPDMLSRLDAAWGKLRTRLFLRLGWPQEGMTKQDLLTSCAQVAAAGGLPEVPLVVITAGQPAQMPSLFRAIFPGAAFQGVMQAGGAVLAGASTQGRQVIDPDSSHTTMLLQDALITQTIREVVEASRQASARSES